MKKGQRELSQEMSRTPTVSELAKYVELPEDDVKDLMCKAGQPVSLETKSIITGKRVVIFFQKDVGATMLCTK